MKIFLTNITLAALLFTVPVMAQDADPAKGAKVFKKCRSCHMVGDKARNLVGPTLNGIVDGKIAAVDGYKYSKAMKKYAAENAVWTQALLEAYLEKPSKAVKGTRMAFVGLRKPKDRKDVIAYLQQFNAQ